MIPNVPPGLILLLGALLIPLLRGRLRSAYLILLPLLSLIHMAGLEQGVSAPVTLAAQELLFLQVDTLSLAFGYVFHLALIVGVIYSLHVNDTTQHVAAVVYAGGTLGAVFAGDLLTLFLFWEVVAVASVFLIWARRTPRAYRSGMRYLLWQVISGLLLLAGILVRYHELGPAGLEFSEIGGLGIDDTSGRLIFLAIGIKCAFPFLHTWLTDAYPEATPTGAVFLSAFTTKLAVYALARGYAGTDELIYVGAVMAGFPIFFAVIENDLRRVLAYSLINQVGFMVVGVGLGEGLGLDGAVAHAFADVIFKGLLFMTMGAVLFRTGKINANELGGLYKTMPFTAACCLVGAASISAFPLFSAFATKSLIMSGAADAGHTVVWFVLLFAAAGVFHHAGIKIPFFAFFGHDSGLRPPDAPLNMKIAMGISALLCVGIGCFPHLLYQLLPQGGMDYHVYTASHVINQLQLLFFSALAFCTLMLSGRYPPELTSINLDADWLWRRPARGVWALITGPLTTFLGLLQSILLEKIPASLSALIQRRGPEGGELARRWAVGSSVLVMMILLGVYLVAGR